MVKICIIQKQLVMIVICISSQIEAAMTLLMYSVTILALAGIVTGLSTCPSKEVVATVQVSVQSVFSRVLVNPIIANTSLTNIKTYEKIATIILECLSHHLGLCSFKVK